MGEVRAERPKGGGETSRCAGPAARDGGNRCWRVGRSRVCVGRGRCMSGGGVGAGGVIRFEGSFSVKKSNWLYANSVKMRVVNPPYRQPGGLSIAGSDDVLYPLFGGLKFIHMMIDE